MDMLGIAEEAKQEEEDAIVEKRSEKLGSFKSLSDDEDAGIRTKFDGIRLDHNGNAYVVNPGAKNGVSGQHFGLQQTLAAKTVRDLEIERDADIKTEQWTAMNAARNGDNIAANPAVLARVALYGDEALEQFKEMHMSSADQVKTYEKAKSQNPTGTRVPAQPTPQPQQPVTPPPVVNPTHPSSKPGDHGPGKK